MLENSLDAGATSIGVLAKGGGLKLLQIQDNGHGIFRDDFCRVCERFATSKLRQYEDLGSIETFGFRGEALASISHVAHVTITSMTANAPCAYRACYADGQLVPVKPGDDPAPKPCAGTRGTLIVAEEMFHNNPARRQAMKGAGEEYGKLLQIVQSYAIDNPGIAISCRKGVDGGAELATTREHTSTDAVRLVYGSSLARELVSVEGEDADLGLKISGLASNANYSCKRLTFLLFINKRLVESASLKRAVEEVYVAYLPKGAHPFVYLSLRLPPAALDVNVHPTKREVHFLDQEKVIERVQSCLKERLVNANTSRTFLTQAVLPGMIAGASDGTGSSAAGVDAGRGGSGSKGGGFAAAAAAAAKPAYDPRKLVRTHATGMVAGELDKYVLRPSASAGSGNVSGGNDATNGTAQAGSGGGGTCVDDRCCNGRDGRGIEGARGGEVGVGVKRQRTATGPGTSPGAADPNTPDEESAPVRSRPMPTNECSSSSSSGGLIGTGAGSQPTGSTAEDAGAGDSAGSGALAVPQCGVGSQRHVGRLGVSRPWVTCELTSIHSLLRKVTAQVSRGLQALFSQHTYVGLVDRRYVLLQHLTKLYVVHIGVTSEAFFYQHTLRSWGNLSTIRLAPPAPIAKLFLLAGGGDEPVNARDEPLHELVSGVPSTAYSQAALEAGERAAELLEEKAEMLLEYLSIEVRDGCLCTLPQLVEGYVPPLNGLPSFIRRLVERVDWTTEQPCFHGLARELAGLFRVDEVGAPEEGGGASDGGGGEGGEGEGGGGGRGVENAEGEEEGKSASASAPIACSEEWTIQHVLLPAMRKTYEPPNAHASNGAVVQAACTEMLYKIFERC